VAGAHAGVERAVADAFEHLASLRMSPFGSCEGCQQTVYREPGTLTLLLLRRSGSMNPASPRPTRPCPRSGREAPVYQVRPEHPRVLGWPPFRVWSFVNCCGHAQEVIRALEADGRCRLIPVLGKAS
jgi:hypothetical protein